MTLFGKSSPKGAAKVFMDASETIRKFESGPDTDTEKKLRIVFSRKNGKTEIEEVQSSLEMLRWVIVIVVFEVFLLGLWAFGVFS